MSAPDHFCGEGLARLQAAGITVPNELINDCDPGDESYILQATALQLDTAQYIGKICLLKNCSAFISVGDNFYDSDVDFTTGSILRFKEAWAQMYNQGILEHAPWYNAVSWNSWRNSAHPNSTLRTPAVVGYHDIVRGQTGVGFEKTIAPVYDRRWYFGSANGDQQ